MSDEDENMCRPNSYVGESYVNDYYNNESESEEEEEEEDVDDNDVGDGVMIGDDDYECGDEDSIGTTEDDDDDDDDDDDGDLERKRHPKKRHPKKRHPKKRKLKTVESSYEFAPRLRASYCGRNPIMDWTEHETFILLDAWGEQYLKQRRKSLRSEEWQEVAEKVSQESGIERTDTQCRNRLDTLKKKYKKEKMKLGGNWNVACEWGYFKKMDELMSSLPQQAGRLSCEMESGEYEFTNPEAYLNQSNGLDELRDSPGNSESGGGREDESKGLPPKRAKRGRFRGTTGSFKMLADSINKFNEIYQKIEVSKREQMVELEKMRMDIQRDLDFQKRQILEKVQAQIEKIGQEDEDDDDDEASAENASG